MGPQTSVAEVAQHTCQILGYDGLVLDDHDEWFGLHLTSDMAHLRQMSHPA